MKADKELLRVYGLVCVMCIPFVLFGIDTGSIGSVTVMPAFEEKFGVLREITRGAVVASLLAASALSGFVAGPIADRISRKFTVTIGLVIFALGNALVIGAPKLSALFVGRVLAGAGEGVFLSPAFTYIVEIAPKSHRGRIAGLPQISICLGILMGYFSCYGAVRIPTSLSYRIPFVIMMALSVVGAIFTPFIVHSPRWLVMRDRMDEARLVLDKLMQPSAQAEKEELLAKDESLSIKSRNIFSKQARASTMWGSWLQAAQQLTGIDFVLFYAPTLFRAAGIQGTAASFFASGVTSIVLLASVTVATPFSDKIKRRWSLTGGGIGIGACLLLMGVLYATNANNTRAGQWSIIVLIELFVIVFSATWSMSIRVYTTEQFHPSVRAAASSFSIAVNQACNTLVALTGPAFLAKSSSGPYFLYGGITLFTAALCVIVMTETSNQSLEALGKLASSGTSNNFSALKDRLRFRKSNYRTNYREGTETPAIELLSNPYECTTPSSVL